MLVLAIGDLHIPARVPEFPSKFKRLLVPGKIGQILCTGNLIDRDTYDFLKSVAPDLHVVKGEYDESPRLPISKVVTHGSLRIGLASGQTIVPMNDGAALSIAARQMNADVLIYGGGSHQFECFETEGKFFICPGSATGAMSIHNPATEDIDPSFVLMDIQGNVLVLYVYHLHNDDVKVEKLQYRKDVQ